MLGAPITGFMAYISMGYSKQVAAYDSAPICASVRQIANCKYVGLASVTAKRIDSGDHLLDLAFAELGGRSYTAIFTSDISPWQSAEKGTAVNAELWQGYISKVNGADTATNPDTLPNSGPLAAYVFGAATLAVVIVLLCLVWLNRRGRGCAQLMFTGRLKAGCLPPALPVRPSMRASR